MTPTEVLKMLKSKIDAAGLNKCNYAIETSDIEAINQALLLYDVVGRSEQLKPEIKDFLMALRFAEDIRIRTEAQRLLRL